MIINRSPISSKGFTLVELMVVVAIIAILATMTMPDQSPKIIKAQIGEALSLVSPYKMAVSNHYQIKQAFPSDNKTLGIDAADKIIGNYITSTEIDNGAINIKFGNKAHNQIQDKILSLRPVFVADAQTPISWVCGYDEVPSGMIATASNQTNISHKFLPAICH